MSYILLHLLIGVLEIQQASVWVAGFALYLQLAKKYHPDANKNSASAKRKFQEIREAYEVHTINSSAKMFILIFAFNVYFKWLFFTI